MALPGRSCEDYYFPEREDDHGAARVAEGPFSSDGSITLRPGTLCQDEQWQGIDADSRERSEVRIREEKQGGGISQRLGLFILSQFLLAGNLTDM